MDVFASFATDEKKEVEGHWFPLSKDAKVLVARAGNANYLKALRKKLEESKLDLDSQDEAANEVAEGVIIEVMARTILVGWEGLSFKGKTMPYSAINAKTLLQVKDFRRKVEAFSNTFDAFKVKSEAELGNASAAT